MRTSESVAKIAPALVKAQKAIGPAHKGKVNPVYKSKYADLSSVFEACLGALNDSGIVLLQMPVHSEDGKVHMTTRLQHDSGEFMEETFSIPTQKQDAHGYGSACTYLRRFSLSAWLGIVTDEDDDGNAASDKSNGARKPEPATTVLPNADKHTAKQAATDALDMFSEQEQIFLREQAVAIIALHESGGNMYDHVHKQKYDNEEKLALWSLLPSNVRSAYKLQERQALASQG